MNRATAENQLIQDFKTWWDATYPAWVNKVAYPDVDFPVPDPPSEWIRISVQWSGKAAGSAGNADDRHTGMAFVELYWPSGHGYMAVNAVAQAVETYFTGYKADGGRLSCCTYDRERPYTIRAPSEPGFTRRTVNAPVRLIEQH